MSDIGSNFQCTKDSKLKTGKRQLAEDSKSKGQHQRRAKLPTISGRQRRRPHEKAAQPNAVRTESGRRAHQKRKDVPPNPVPSTVSRGSREPPLSLPLPLESSLGLILPVTMMAQMGVRVWVPMVYAPVVGGGILVPSLNGELNEALANSQCGLNTNSCS